MKEAVERSLPARWLRDSMAVFARRGLPPFIEDALQYTRFALEQFKECADRDGAKLVILASHSTSPTR